MAPQAENLAFFKGFLVKTLVLEEKWVYISFSKNLKFFEEKWVYISIYIPITPCTHSERILISRRVYCVCGSEKIDVCVSVRLFVRPSAAFMDSFGARKWRYQS